MLEPLSQIVKVIKSENCKINQSQCGWDFTVKIEVASDVLHIERVPTKWYDHCYHYWIDKIIEQMVNNCQKIYGFWGHLN